MTSENIYQAPESNLSTNQNGDYEFAGFWIRVVASLIDTVLMLFITMPVLMMIYGKDYWFSESMIKGVWDVLFSYVIPAVIVIVFWAYKSATPGKMIFGLKVISLGNDSKLSRGQLIGRYLGYYVSTIVFLLGFIWVAFDKRKQGWHDKMANTAVVKVRHD
jgi:uncharacterized RDD family membrane protein YckC